MAGVIRGKFKRNREALIPIGALIRQESLVTLRGARTYYVLVLVLGAMVTVLTNYLVDLQGIELDSARAMSELTTVMFYIFGYGLYTAGMLLVPPIAAATLCNDKQQERLDLVRMTHISPLTLLLGKFTSICGLYTLVAIAALPISGVMLFFTGVSPAQYLQLFLLVFLSVGSATAVGLLFSAWFYRPILAMLFTYMAVLVTQAGLALALGIALRLHYSGMAGLALTQVDWLDPLAASLCPAYGISQLSITSLDSSFYLIAPLFHGAIIAVATWKARRLLNRPLPAMRVDTRKVIDDPALLEERRTKFPYYLLDPQRRRALIGDRQNPVLVKERYTGMANRGTTAIRILYAMAILAVVLGAFSTVTIELVPDGGQVASMFLLVETLLLCLAAPLFVATALSKEREWGNWDMLRMTLLTPRQVVLGKVQAALQSLALPAAALLIGTLPLWLVGFGDSSVLVGLSFGTVKFFVSVIYVVALSFFAGTGHSRSTAALSSAYGVCIAAFLGAPALIYAYINYLDPARTFDEYLYNIETAAWYSPLMIGFLQGDFDYELTSLYLQSHAATFLSLSAGLVGLAVFRCNRHWSAPKERRSVMLAFHNRKNALP